MIKKNNKTEQNRERDEFTVVLESIQSDFQMFGEKLELMDEKIEGRFNTIDNRLDRIEAELINIKLEISDLKTKLDKKADLERLENLEKRVKQIETICQNYLTIKK